MNKKISLLCEFLLHFFLFHSCSGEFLDFNHPAVKLSLFSAPMTNDTDMEVRGAFASLFAAKKLQQR